MSTGQTDRACVCLWESLFLDIYGPATPHSPSRWRIFSTRLFNQIHAILHKWSLTDFPLNNISKINFLSVNIHLHHHFIGCIKVCDFTQYLTNFFLKSIKVVSEFFTAINSMLYIHLCVFVWLPPRDIFLEIAFGFRGYVHFEFWFILSECFHLQRIGNPIKEIKNKERIDDVK